MLYSAENSPHNGVLNPLRSSTVPFNEEPPRRKNRYCQQKLGSLQDQLTCTPIASSKTISEKIFPTKKRLSIPDIEAIIGSKSLENTVKMLIKSRLSRSHQSLIQGLKLNPIRLCQATSQDEAFEQTDLAYLLLNQRVPMVKSMKFYYPETLFESSLNNLNSKQSHRDKHNHSALQAFLVHSIEAIFTYPFNLCLSHNSPTLLNEKFPCYTREELTSHLQAMAKFQQGPTNFTVEAFSEIVQFHKCFWYKNQQLLMLTYDHEGCFKTKVNSCLEQKSLLGYIEKVRKAVAQDFFCATFVEKPQRDLCLWKLAVNPSVQDLLIGCQQQEDVIAVADSVIWPLANRIQSKKRLKYLSAKQW